VIIGLVTDDPIEWGRVSNCDAVSDTEECEELVERAFNYAFEGEQIQWKT